MKIKRCNYINEFLMKRVNTQQIFRMFLSLCLWILLLNREINEYGLDVEAFKKCC